jgi:citrate lyase subunit beta/citryl-CoA lyase
MQEIRRPSRTRSLLFIPAAREDFVAKAPSRGADVVILDCEDATAAPLKEAARTLVRELTPALVEQGCAVAVRVNALASQWGFDDLDQGLCPELSAVIVPKVERLDELDTIAARLDAAGLPALGVVAGVETALGVADARSLLAHPRVIGAYFGAEDFVTDLGGVRTTSNVEVAHARGAMVLAGRLAGVPVLDQVVTDFRDDERFRVEASEARSMGYAGKLCIHPSQVVLANEAFTPSDAELDRARRLVAAYDDGIAAGLGAISFDGQMVDEPLAARARALLAQIDRS